MSTADLARFRLTFSRAKADSSWPACEPKPADDTPVMGLCAASSLISDPAALCAACLGPKPCREAWVTIAKTGHVYGYGLCFRCAFHYDQPSHDALCARVNANFDRLRGAA